MFKSKLLLYSILFLLIGLFSISDTNSVFSDQATVTTNNVSVDYWVEISFYLREDKKAVGFRADNVSYYDKLDYAIDYTHDSIDEHIEGTIDNSGGDNTITREWFLLGGCSGLGEVCWYHDGVHEVDLTIVLTKGGGEPKTINKSITL